MPSVSYRSSLQKMLRDQPEIAIEMLEDAVAALLSGDVDEGRLLLRQYINGTLGFQELESRTGKNCKALMRMLSASGNPTASNLFDILRVCMETNGVILEISVKERPAA